MQVMLHYEIVVMQVTLHDERIVMQVTLHFDIIVMQVTLHHEKQKFPRVKVIYTNRWIITLMKIFGLLYLGLSLTLHNKYTNRIL